MNGVFTKSGARYDITAVCHLERSEECCAKIPIPEEKRYAEQTHTPRGYRRSKDECVSWF